MKMSNNIVLLDDEPLVTKTLSTLLRLEGFLNVVCFNEPLVALEYLKENSCDLIISDFIMPKMDGIEFLSSAKKLQKDNECSHILLTGYADKENAIKAINEVGIFKYIEKPWNNDNLIMNIKNALERTGLKKALKEKISELEIANTKLEDYSKNLEELVKQRTCELNESNQKLSAIITSCADGIVIFDNENRIVSINSAVCGLFGLLSKDIVGKNFFELVINEKNQKNLNPFISSVPLFLRDFSLVNYKSDKKVPIEISLANIENSETELAVCVIRDVSYQKENERLRDDFIATLTHDLRTPLLAAISGLDFILDGTLGDMCDRQKELIGAMKKSNEDMLGLTNALLEVYRYEAGKIYLCKTKFSICELVKDCALELDVLFKSNNMSLKLEFCDENIEINADRREIKRVVLNLLGNAIKHSGDETAVVLKVESDANDLIVSVKDNGIGLSEEDVKRLFKRFSQGTSQKRSTSTGLGLYLSRQIIEAHGGLIGVQSELNFGSEFKFSLKNVIIESKVLL